MHAPDANAAARERMRSRLTAARSAQSVARSLVVTKMRRELGIDRVGLDGATQTSTPVSSSS
jgi:hypothetical protein